MIATKPVDFRKGVDGLAAIVATELKLEPFTGIVYVFRSKRADRVKLLFWDGTGVCLVAKRLEDGKCRWPMVDNGVMRLSPGSFPRGSKASIGPTSTPSVSYRPQ